MTQNQFKMLLCAGAGCIVAYLRNLDTIPTSDDVQWTVDYTVPFVAGFFFCYAALSAWQWFGDNFWTFKSWTSRHFDKLWRDMTRED